jgi:hypothetical protein
VRIAKPKRSVPVWLRPWLAVLPWALLALAILTALDVHYSGTDGPVAEAAAAPAAPEKPEG